MASASAAFAAIAVIATTALQVRRSGSTTPRHPVLRRLCRDLRVHREGHTLAHTPFLGGVDHTRDTLPCRTGASGVSGSGVARETSSLEQAPACGPDSPTSWRIHDGGSGDSQASTLQFLSKRESHGGHDVTQVVTHVSVVFLAGERAYKLKRAVRYPHADYSDPSVRRRHCVAEAEAGVRMSPELYVGVQPVVRDTASRCLSWGKLVWPLPEGPRLWVERPDVEEIVDWVVVMRRRPAAPGPADSALHRHTASATVTGATLASEGRLSHSQAVAIGRAVAEAHSTCPVVAADSRFATPDHIIETAEAIVCEMCARQSVFEEDDLAQLLEATRAVVARLSHVMGLRLKKGFVRHCHGDLHLGNVCFLDVAQSTVTVCDPLDFDGALTSTDMLFDLASLLVDCELADANSRHGLANACLNGYMTRSGDYEGLLLMPLFLSLRAAVRAKVFALEAAALASQQRTAAASARRATARQCCAMAIRLLKPSPPCLVAIGGSSGTGKSTLAFGLAPRLAPWPGAIVVRSDVVRKQMLGVGELDKLSADSAFTAEQSDRVYSVVRDRVRRALLAGHSAVSDSVCARRDQRDAIERVAADVSNDRQRLRRRLKGHARVGDGLTSGVSPSRNDVIGMGPIAPSYAMSGSAVSGGAEAPAAGGPRGADEFKSSEGGGGGYYAVEPGDLGPCPLSVDQDDAHSDAVAFHGLWLVASLHTAVSRVSGRRGDASDATAQVVRSQYDSNTGDNVWEQIDAEREPDEVLSEALSVVIGR